MRRAGLGDGAAPGSYGNYGYASSGYNACEEENDRLTESLRSKVDAIKSKEKTEFARLTEPENVDSFPLK